MGATRWVAPSLFLPSQGIGRDVLANPVQFPFITDYALIVVALPHRHTGCLTQSIDLFCADRFELPNDGTQ